MVKDGLSVMSGSFGVTGELNCMGHASARPHCAVIVCKVIQKFSLYIEGGEVAAEQQRYPIYPLNKGGGRSSEVGRSCLFALFIEKGKVGEATENHSNTNLDVSLEKVIEYANINPQ